MLSAYAEAKWPRDWKRCQCVRSLEITTHTGRTPRLTRAILWLLPTYLIPMAPRQISGCADSLKLCMVGSCVVAFNQCSIGDETLRPNMVALQPVQPRSSIWSNNVFRVLYDDDGSAPAFNSMYFQRAEPKEQLFGITPPWRQLLTLACLWAPWIQTPHS